MAWEMPSSMSRPQQFRHQKPLADDLSATGPLRTKSNKRKARREDEAKDSFIDSRSSRKILKIGQELAEEDQGVLKSQLANPAFTFESRINGSESGGEQHHDDGDEWGDDDDSIIEEAV